MAAAMLRVTGERGSPPLSSPGSSPPAAAVAAAVERGVMMRSAGREAERGCAGEVAEGPLARRAVAARPVEGGCCC